MTFVAMTAGLCAFAFASTRATAQDDAAYRAQLDYTPQVLTSVDGYDVLTLGDLEYLSASPTYQTDLTLQTGNDAPRKTLAHRHSDQIASNYMGTTPPRLPRSEIGEEFPWAPMLMIDGDRSGGWLGGGVVRIDFPKNTRITRIVIWPTYERMRGFDRPDFVAPQSVPSPADFDIRVSTDAASWQTVAEARNLVPPDEGPAGTFEFDPVVAKQVQIVPHRLPWGFAEVEVFDEKGENVALVTRGTNVIVSGTSKGAAGSRMENGRRWPLHWVLGTKWMRVGYWNDASNWHRVEREKGVLHLDPVTEAAIKLASQRGVEVVLCLAYGNSLYENDGRKTPRPGQGYTVSWTLPVPKSAEGIDAYARYCAHMAGRFKGVVRYYEIWNEMDSPEIVSSTQEEYSKVVRAASRAIRTVDPEARIVLGGTGSLNTRWTYACLETGIADDLDVIAFHPYMMSSQPEDAVFMPGATDYASQLDTYIEGTRARGFQGTFMANEIAWKANYPQSKTKDPKLPFWSHYDVTELTKAKYLARTMLLHAAYGIPTFWNESWTGPGSLVRHGASLVPDASWYVMRTLSVATDGLQAHESRSDGIAISAEVGDHSLQAYSYVAPNGDAAVALWLWREGEDDCPGVEADVALAGITATRAVGVDILNGFEQELRIDATDDGAILPGIRIRDYPLLIRLLK